VLLPGARGRSGEETANKVKVEDVVPLWRTGEPIRAVAEEYDLSETVVEDVLRQAA
jgi:uncharacterized protein (DUF433 family)